MIDMKNAYLKVLGLADGQKPQEVQEGYKEQEAQYRKEAIKHAERILASVKNENLDGCKYLSRQLQDMADAMDSRIEDSEKYASAEMKEEVELDAETLDFVNKLSESGFDEYEIQSIIAKLSEGKSKKEDDEDDDTEQEFGDNMSDGEIEFANKHEVEVTDGTAKKMDHGKSAPKAVEPKATPVNQKPVVDYPNKDKPEVAVKSQASQPK